MSETKIMRVARLFQSASVLGLTSVEIEQLIRIERTLHRWDEQECGDGNDYCSWSIERDETTGKPFRVVHPHHGKSSRTAIPDREARALRRLDAIMRNYPHLVAHHQTDPRGCALYLVRKSDVAGRSVDSCYSSGLAVCV